MKKRKFNFKGSVGVIGAKGCGIYRPEKGFENLAILSLELDQVAHVPVDDVMFLVSNELAQSTAFPCFDPENYVMAFSSENSMRYHLEMWDIAPDADSIVIEPIHKAA